MQWQMIKDSVLFALSSGFSVSLFHFYLKKKSTRGVLFCISSFISLHRSLYLLLAYCLYWRQFRSRDLSFNLFPVGIHSLGHVICLLIYFRLAAMLLNILKCISIFILLPLTRNIYMYNIFVTHRTSARMVESPRLLISNRPRSLISDRPRFQISERPSQTTHVGSSFTPDLKR